MKRLCFLLFVITGLRPTPCSASVVESWRSTEIIFTSNKAYASPFNDVDLSATFKGPNGISIVRPAFWDGGRIWKIRFAPSEAGNWTFITHCSDRSNNGLEGQTGTIECVSYSGNLPIFKYGVLTLSKNKRNLAFRDQTPFFWLGDVHWLWEAERLEESNKPGWSSEFRGMADRRAQQGFTVYQVELFGRWKGAPLGGSAKSDLPELNLEQFQKNIDPKWRYLADHGIVVATTLGILPKDITPTAGTSEARMARYVCARYGAYPAVWLMFQECTGNFKDQFSNADQRLQYMNVVRQVGRSFKENDGYHQPRTAHSDSSIVTAYRGDDWLDFTAFQGGHSQVFDTARYLDFYFDPKVTLPQVETEADFDHLFDHGDSNQSQLVTTGSMRDKAYKAILSGCCGYTYGANGVWQATWDDERTGNQTVYGATPWRDGIDLPGGEQMKYLAQFFSFNSWQKLLPRPACDGFYSWPDDLPIAQSPVIASDLYATTLIAYFPSGSPRSLALHQLQPLKYQGRWFDPRTGQYRTLSISDMGKDGDWICPPKPDANDWILELRAENGSGKTLAKYPSRWIEAKEKESRELKKNIAPRAVIKASSTDLTNKVYAPEYAVDGNTDMFDWHHWSNDGATDPATPQKPVRLELDWGSLKPIQNVVVYTMKNYEVRDFEIQVDDGSGWKTVPGGIVTDNESTKRILKLSRPLVVRKLRILGRSGPLIQPTIFRIVELQVFTP